MKKSRALNIKVVLLLLLSAMLIFALAGCGLFFTPLKSISFSTEEITIFKGQTYQLAPKMTPSNAKTTLVYSSSDTSVLTVSDTGLCKGVDVGEATVTVKGDGTDLACSLKVNVGFDTLSKATLSVSSASDGKRVQLIDEITTTYPKNVELQVNINNTDYTDGDFTYNWYFYTGTKRNGQLTAEEISAALTAEELIVISNVSSTSYKNTFTFPDKDPQFYPVIVKVTENNKESPRSVWTNILTFGVYEDMSDVLVYIEDDGYGNFVEESGFENSGSELYPAIAQHGSTVYVKVRWNSDANADPTIQWSYSYKSTSSGAWSNETNVIGQSGSTLAFLVEDEGFYKINVTVDGINAYNTSTLVKFSTRAADVADVALGAKDPSNNAISSPAAITQSNTSTFAVTYTATWNSDFSGTSKPIKWYVNNVEQAEQTAATFAYTPPSTVGTYIVKVTVFNSETDTVGVSATSTITVVAHYDAVSKVTLSTSDATKQAKTSASESFAAFTVSAELSPSTNVNPIAVVEWYVLDPTTSNTFALKQSGTSRTYTYTPTASSAGEVFVYSVVDNVKSNLMTFVLLDETTNADPNINTRLSTTFVWGGISANCYITSQPELNNAICYILANRLDSVMSFTLGGTLAGVNVGNAASAALASYEESGSYNISITQKTSGAYSYLEIKCDEFTAELAAEPTRSYEDIDPDGKDSTLTQSATANYVPDAAAVADTTRVLAVDSFPAYSVDVTSSNILYSVVRDGYKPAFGSDASGVALATLYAKARTVLQTICTDSMTDYEKVLAIYEWIVYEVEYDTDLSEIATDYEAIADSSWSAETKMKERLKYSLTFDGFYLEGVFNDKLAVCDGKSKAFTLLCGMEGITTERVIGYAGSGSLGRHAWNKVLLDVDPTDNNAVKEWYIVDTTWGDSSNGTKEYLNHAYFLVSEAECTTHHEDRLGFAYGETGYDSAERLYSVADTSVGNYYYQNASVTANGEKVSFYISSQAQLNKVIDYAEAHHVNVELCYDSTVFSSESAFLSALGSAVTGSYSRIPLGDGAYIVILG